MRSIVRAVAGQPLRLMDRPVPDPAGGELVRVEACGVCHTDLHVADGEFGAPGPLVLGHEVVGRHEELGRVLVYAPWGCRRPDCRSCSDGLEMICPRGREAGMVSDGGYAEWLRVPSRDYLVPVGDLDPFRAAPLACGGLTAWRAVRRAAAHLSGPRARVAVVGAGGLGQYAVQFLSGLTGAEVTVVEPSDVRRRRALDLGAATAVTPDRWPADCDVVLDFVGSSSTLTAGVKHLRGRGLLVVVGMYGGRVLFGHGAVPSEAVLTTSVWGSLADLHDLLAHERKHPVQHAVEVLPLTAAQTALERLRAGDVLGRLVLDCSSSR